MTLARTRETDYSLTDLAGMAANIPCLTLYAIHKHQIGMRSIRNTGWVAIVLR